MKEKDRKAWVRIVEAFLGILIIMGIVLIILSKQDFNSGEGRNIYEKQRAVLEIISKNNSLRGFVLDENYNEIDDTISKLIPLDWGFDTKICILDDICNSGETPNSKEIYTTEIVITSTLNQYSPKKLRFFVWMK